MFTEIFIETLQNKKITPYQVAKSTGILQGLMGEYKQGKKLPSLQNLVKIADYLDCSVDYLLGRSDNFYMSNSFNNSHSIVSGNQSQVINNTVEAKKGDLTCFDEMTQELVKAFQKLKFTDKLYFLNNIIQKSNEK